MRINASFLLNAPAWTPKIKKTPRAFIGSFTVCLHKVATTTRKPALRFAGTSFFAGISQSSETQGQSVGSGENTGRKFSSTGERTPGYRLSPNYFQKFKRIPAPDWAQKCFVLLSPISEQFLLTSFREFVHDSYCLATLARCVHQAWACKENFYFQLS